jgi:hypothetical protein
LNILVQHPGRQFKAIEGRRTPFTTPGWFKGMKVVLEEWGLWQLCSTEVIF